MDNVELVIRIPEDEYRTLKETGFISSEQRNMVVEAIANGKPLPKGHGRLIDADWIDDNCPDYRTEDGAWCYKWEDIDNAPTIIEADKAESEDKE